MKLVTLATSMGLGLALAVTQSFAESTASGGASSSTGASASIGSAGVSTGLSANTSGVIGRTTGSTTANNNANINSTGNTMKWDSENRYWRNNYSTRPYYNNSRDYSVYEPAYRYGADVYGRNTGRTYGELDQEQLRKGWEQARGTSSLTWDEAQLATRDAYGRLYDNRGNTATAGATGNISTTSPSR